MINTWKSLPVCLLAFFLSFGAAVNLEAATLKVDPSMTRAAIQAVIDSAGDNDTIRFAAGNYDFSGTPFSVRPWSTSGGALIVTDKSLKFVADKGVTLTGADSILDGDGIGTSGIIAFNVNNSATKDVSFKGFVFNKFLMAVVSGVQVSYDPATGAEVMAPSCRDFTVQNCTFQNIHRNVIAPTGVQRNLKIIKNTIVSCRRFGMYIDWSTVGGGTGSQPTSGKITMTNNVVQARVVGVYIIRGRNMSIKNNSFDATGSEFTDTEGLIIDGGAVAPGIVNNKFTNLGYALDLNAWDANGAFPFTGGKITNNKITASLGGIWSGGRDFHGNKFTNNTITVTDTNAFGIGLYGNYGDTLTNNKILGVGDVAIYVRGFDNTGAGGTTHFPHHNLLKKNSVKGFAVNEGNADYVMGSVSHDNTAIGICPENATFYDEGTNNVFTCIFPNDAAPANLINGFALSTRNHIDRKPLER